MTKKRKQPDSNHSDTLFTSKRSRPNQSNGSDDAPSAAQARIDPTYGQRGAFPGLDGPVVGEDELFYGPAEDGLEYLRMVRLEAKTVPNLLVAPISPTASDKKKDIYSDYPQGYYADGAYTALPPPSSSSTFQNRRKDSASAESSEIDTQDAYYTSLLTRFHTLSTHLHHPPALPPNGILDIPSGFNTRKSWRNKLLRTRPKMGILALLQQEMVIVGLDVLEEVLTVGNLKGEVGRGVGAWAWGLLARCRELGTMASEEVGVLRRVGKRAVWLLRRLKAGSVVEDQGVGVDDEEEDAAEEGEEEGDGDEDQDEDDCEEATDVASEIVDEVITTAIDPIDPTAINPTTPIDPITSVDSITPIDPIISLPQPSAQLLSPPAEQDPDSALAIEEARARMLASLASTQDLPKDVNQNTDQSHQHQQQHPQQDPNTEIAMDGDDTQGMGKVEGSDEQDMHATLDMIVTVVGEVYGQRDLLDGRVVWGEILN